jgi:bifunctional DNA-binding transcriptional regulator/antitoxin component of YhaV-PrlF toxin-antitoxin module
LKLVVESKIGKKRVVVIPKAIADVVKVYEEQKIRIIAEDNKIIIEPVRDAIWLAPWEKDRGDLSRRDRGGEST